MFIVRWIRYLLSLPILWLGELALRFDVSASVALLSAAWAVSRDAEMGRTALAAVRKLRGRDAALAQARAWLERHPRPHFAAFAGLMCVEANQPDAAKAFLARGRELGDDRMGGLDWIEYLIAGMSGNELEVARKFESRTDLPAHLSKAVLTELMLDDLLSGRFDGAKRRAEHLLEVADDPVAEMVLWALAMRAGDATGAGRHYERAEMPGSGTPPLSAAQKSYFMCLGCVAIGATGQANEVLATLRNQNEALAQRAESILRSRESLHVAENDAAVPAGPAGGDHGA